MEKKSEKCFQTGLSVCFKLPTLANEENLNAHSEQQVYLTFGSKGLRNQQLFSNSTNAPLYGTHDIQNYIHKGLPQIHNHSCVNPSNNLLPYLRSI
jgi:hypothetical protein